MAEIQLILKSGHHLASTILPGNKASTENLFTEYHQMKRMFDEVFVVMKK